MCSKPPFRLYSNSAIPSGTALVAVSAMLAERPRKDTKATTAPKPVVKVAAPVKN